MAKRSNAPSYPVLKDLLLDANSRKNVHAVLVIAFDEWQNRKLNDYVFADLLKVAADRLNII